MIYGTNSFSIRLSIMLLIVSSFTIAQVRDQQIDFEDLIRKPVPHESAIREMPVNSLYQLREDWDSLIDSTWGFGIPYEQKLTVFNSWANIIHDDWGCFTNWDADWDSVRAFYSTLMDDNTLSHGNFVAIMSHMAHDMREYHTFSWDETVTGWPLNPGTPLLILGGDTDLSHFGAVTTTLADSTLLVLRTIEDHPLDLQPGDILLGYEGQMWRDLVFELLEARLPLWARGSGCTTTNIFNCLITMGSNWHMFDTMDVLKFASGDTVHLSLEPMLELVVDHPWMPNNEQLAVPGIPMPDYEVNGTNLVTHGIIEDTNIGYIYMWNENAATEQSFANAIADLFETDGLIIDLRFNLGGWATFGAAFDLLFNSRFYTIADALRCNSIDFTMCPDGSEGTYEVDGSIDVFYDRPILVLTGHNSASMGDITTWWLSHHPNSRILGRPTNASPNWNESINFTNWNMRMAIGDMYVVSDPDSFMTGIELPIDDPVWFTPGEVASGIDGVVESAKSWITNLAYAHDLELDASYYSPGEDSILITTVMENADEHELSISGEIVDSDTSIVNSFILNDDGAGGDLLAGDGIWSYGTEVSETESFYAVNIQTTDETYDWTHHLPKVKRYTTGGPVSLVGVELPPNNPDPNPGEYIPFYIHLTNAGDILEIPNVRASIETQDPFVASIADYQRSYGEILPGDSARSSFTYFLTISEECPSYHDILIQVEIFSEGYSYWTDEFTLQVQPELGIADGKVELPTEYALEQNFPNPFNPSTTISYSLPLQSEVNLTVFDIRGQVIRTLREEVKAPGNYQMQWNGMDNSGDPVSTGVYFCRLEAGDFSQTVKMVYLR